MSGMPSRYAGLARRLAFALPLLLTAAPAEAAEAVLLSSTVPGYSPGRSIEVADRLVVPQGTRMTLLFRSGQMLQLRGPFDGTLASAAPRPDQDTVPALAQFFRLRGVDVSVVGGTRSSRAFDVAARPQDVLVDPGQSAAWCLGPADTIWLRRPASAQRLELRHRGTIRELAIPAGADRIAWPEDVPVEQDDRFELLVDGTARATLVFHRMQRSYPSPAAWVASGVLAGCHDQFDAELRSLRRNMLAEGALPAE